MDPSRKQKKLYTQKAEAKIPSFLVTVYPAPVSFYGHLGER